MSAPICGWAFKTGRARGLSPSERLVLWALAERVNGTRGELVCWPSISMLLDDTGLASRHTVIGALRSLVAHALIAVAKRGRGHQYTLLAVQSVHRSPVHSPHQSKAHIGAIGAPVIGASTAPAGGKRPGQPVQSAHLTGAISAPRAVQNLHSNLLREPIKEPVAREEARSGAASGPEPGKEDSSGGNGAPPPPPVPGPAKAPTIGPSDTTTGGGSTYRKPGATPPTDTFNEFLDAPSPAKALPCEIEQEVVHADPLDLPVDPDYVRTVVAELRHEFRMRAYPGRAAAMSPNDMIDAVAEKPRPKAYLLNGEALAAARKHAGIIVNAA